MWTVSAKFRVQSAKYTVCGQWARDQSVAVALLQLLQSQQPTVGKQPLALSHPRGAFWTKENHIQSYLSVVL